MAMMAQDGTCLISRSSRKENYGVVMEKSDNYFQGKRYVAALIAAMTLLSGAGFTASVASADTDTRWAMRLVALRFQGLGPYVGSTPSISRL